MSRFVTYYRVSTEEQGRSGLGLGAQRQAVAQHLGDRASGVLAEYVEVESGKRSTNRPQLQAALARCRKERATLVIAKLDRLARNVAFIAGLMESGVDFVAADNPHANKFTTHVLAAVAEYERDMISKRTREALAAAKARGQRLGAYGADVLAPRHRAEAAERALALAPVLGVLRAEGATTVRALVDGLNARGVAGPNGGRWHVSTLHRVLARLNPA